MVSEYEQLGLEMRVAAPGGRGNTSPEAAMVQECRNRYRRAEKSGYHSMEDRYTNDIPFMERMLEINGIRFKGGPEARLSHTCSLCNPPRSSAQVSLRVAYDEDHSLARLAYVDIS